MRVITGTARGRKLETLRGSDVRPTTDRVKEAVFSVIQFETEGRTFLDLFSGSGQMGIEALSRGAEKAYFTDCSKNSIDVIRRNIAAVGFEKKARVIQADFRSFLAAAPERFDIAYLDPPYRAGILREAFEKTVERMKDTGVVITENSVDEQPPEGFGDFVADRQYRYGKIRVCTFRHKDYLK